MLEFIIHLRQENNYKRKGQYNPKVHTNTHRKTTPSHFFSLNHFLHFWLKYWSVFGKHHTGVLHFFLKLSYRFGPETWPIAGSSIQSDVVLNLVIFRIIFSSYIFRLWFLLFSICSLFDSYHQHTNGKCICDKWLAQKLTWLLN